MSKKRRKMTAFGRKCKAAGVSAYRISNETGVNVMTVWNWMVGHSRPMAGGNLAAVMEWCDNHDILVSLQDFSRYE